jgi:hypothetical protein
MDQASEIRAAIRGDLHLTEDSPLARLRHRGKLVAAKGALDLRKPRRDDQAIA